MEVLIKHAGDELQADTVSLQSLSFFKIIPFLISQVKIV